jgi:hypothetical protein
MKFIWRVFMNNKKKYKKPTAPQQTLPHMIVVDEKYLKPLKKEEKK